MQIEGERTIFTKKKENRSLHELQGEFFSRLERFNKNKERIAEIRAKLSQEGLEDLGNAPSDAEKPVNGNNIIKNTIEINKKEIRLRRRKILAELKDVENLSETEVRSLKDMLDGLRQEEEGKKVHVFDDIRTIDSGQIKNDPEEKEYLKAA